MNQYLFDLNKSLAGRYSTESVGMTIGEWICANTSYRGKPFTFEGYGFQKAIADDDHPNLDVMKISQVGLTEIQARKALALLIRNPGRVGIFSLPDEVMFRRFSQQRLQPIVKENKVFNTDADAESVRSMSLMQFGRSFLNVVNVVEGSATSIPADFVFNDEVDLSDQKILSLFSSRLQNSNWKIKQRFSTPSWTGFGIDATYSVSDQREYFCKCDACNKQQIPLFDRRHVYIPGLPTNIKLEDITVDIREHLDLKNAYVQCNNCGAPLDLDNSNREWVAAHPHRQHARGYRVRPFSSGRISIEYIIDELLAYRRKDFLRGWFNTVLGEPYIDAKARLDEATIKACMTTEGIPDIDPQAPVFIGIDVGQICHIILGTPRAEGLLVFQFLSVRVKDLADTIRELDQKYRIVQGTCDRHPYTPDAEELRDITDGRIMPLEYRGTTELKPVKELGTETVIHWQADRTKLIDEAAKLVRTKSIRFAGYGSQSAIIVEHLRDMIREEDPEKPARWVKLNGNDHYFHALAFLKAATRLAGVMETISVPDLRSYVMMAGLGSPKTKSLLAGRRNR